MIVFTQIFTVLRSGLVWSWVVPFWKTNEGLKVLIINSITLKFMKGQDGSWPNFPAPQKENILINSHKLHRNDFSVTEKGASEPVFMITQSKPEWKSEKKPQYFFT